MSDDRATARKRGCGPTTGIFTRPKHIEGGALRPVVDRRYRLDQMADAHRHAEGGHKRGHVVVLYEASV